MLGSGGAVRSRGDDQEVVARRFLAPDELAQVTLRLPRRRHQAPIPRRPHRQVCISERLAKDRDERLAAMAGAVRISLIAFGVAAFFYPVAYYFYFYYLAGLAVALRNTSGSATS